MSNLNARAGLAAVATNIVADVAGNNTLVAAPTGVAKIRVLSIKLNNIGGAAVTVSLQSGAGGAVILGPLMIPASGGFIDLDFAALDGDSLCECAAATLLNLTSSAATSVRGVVVTQTY